MGTRAHIMCSPLNLLNFNQARAKLKANDKGKFRVFFGIKLRIQYMYIFDIEIRSYRSDRILISNRRKFLFKVLAEQQIHYDNFSSIVIITVKRQAKALLTN